MTPPQESPVMRRPHIPRAKVKGVIVIEADPRKRKTSHQSQNGFAKSQPTTIKAGYPLRLLLPETASSPTGCPWIYPLTYGGGLVAGDDIELNIKVSENCQALLTSQESSKVYHSEDGVVSKQTYNYTIDKGGLLCILPDPVVCYKDANYVQTQVVNMSSHGNLVMLDWFLAGRVARNELWEFHRFVNRLDVCVEGELVLRERGDLANTPTMRLTTAMGHYQVVAMFLVLGRKLEGISDGLFTKFGLPQEFGSAYNTKCLVSATKLSYKVKDDVIKGVFIKVMAQSTDQAFFHIREMVAPFLPFVGGNPFQTKY